MIQALSNKIADDEVKKVWYADDEVKKVWYADDSSAVGPLAIV